MFAFAIWDTKKKELFLARDRTGQKPLFYRLDDKIFHFASEIKAIIKDPAVEARPNLTAIDHYMTWQCVPAPYSAFEGTELDSWLKESGVRRLFIGGLATEYCVLNTARDAVNNGYEVHLMTDAIRAIDPAEGDSAIESLRELHAMIVDSGEILDEPH